MQIAMMANTKYYSTKLMVPNPFYVEVYYHKEYNVLRKFKPFKSMELLDIYADQIDVLKLLNG